MAPSHIDRSRPSVEQRQARFALPPLVWIVLLGGFGSACLPDEFLAASAQAPAAKNLSQCPGFAPQEGLRPTEVWTVFQPAFSPAQIRPTFEERGVIWESPDRPFAVGAISQRIDGIQGGRSYLLQLSGTAWNLKEPVQRTVLARVTFLRQGKPTHPAGMLARECQVSQGGADTTVSFTLRDVFAAPEDADGAEISLEIKWLRGGRVRLENVVFQETAPVAGRTVKIGTIHFRPRNGSPTSNLERFAEYIDRAGQLGLDAVCLGEGITVVGTNESIADVAEPIPGPSTEYLGRCAAKNRLWVVAGLYERDGSTLYNTAVLIDRQGNPAGKYRKVHLPREEWRQGITPGDDYPVFQTDFGRVAIQICYDWFFPEVASMWRIRGAEVVFAPTWGTTFPDQEGRVEGENVFRVRARDGGFFLVASVYDGSSLVIDPLGRVLARNDGKEGVFWAEVNLEDRHSLPWVGDWRAIGPRHRMPETYGPLTEATDIPR
ncbi:carbon-nitrogen hydrolase family protein [Thermopirellula anaerolimosa]